MKQRFKRVALLVLIVSALGLPAATAHETDQFTLPEGRAFAELGPYYNRWAFDAIARGVKKTNDRIRAAQRQSAKALVDAQSPDVIAHDVDNEFPSAFNIIEGVDALADSREMADKYPGRVVGYKEPFTNIYEHVHFVLDPRQLFRIWHASTVMIYGHYVGGDKLGHFVDMGMYYYEAYRKVITKGGDEKAGLAAANEVGAHGLIFSERGMLGNLSAGDYSNADMAANYLGMLFYRNLTEPVMLKGKLQPAMLVKDGDFWKTAPHVSRDSDFFAVFIDEHLDEAINPGLFESGMRSDLRKAVLERTERILNRRVDAHGNRRSKAYFDQRLADMKTYYGQEYGYDGKYEEFISIGNTCFEYVGPEADVNHRDPQGNTPLHTACWTGGVGVAKKLIERGADVNASVRSSEGWSPEWGNTPLHYACRAGSKDIVVMLLDKGANVNAANDRGQTPLHQSLASPEIVSLLLERGARVDAKDNTGQAPLHWAAGDGQDASLELLLSHGASVEAADNAARTALHLAAQTAAEIAARMLLDHGAKVTAAANMAVTPLHLAAGGNTGTVVGLLVERGAAVNAIDEFGCTPLHYAARSGNAAAITALLQHGAAAATGDAHHVTPLHLAARNGRAAAVKALLAGKADINAKSSNGTTILHEAAVGGDDEIARAVIAAGGDRTARNAKGLTAADLATAKGNREVATALQGAAPAASPGSH